MLYGIALYLNYLRFHKVLGKVSKAGQKDSTGHRVWL